MTTRASVSPVNLLIRGGYVLTMDSLGDLAGGDVHVRDGDPARLLVTAATPRDVELVIVDGRILKRDGVVTAFEIPDVVRAARGALAGVLSRAGY